MTVGRLSLNPTEGASVKIRCRPLMSGLGNLRALQRNARFWHDRPSHQTWQATAAKS